MRNLLFMLLSTLALPGFAQELISNRQRDIVFRGVNVIPMDRERVIENQTVVVRDGRIIKIVPNSKIFKKGAGSLVIDARGKYLVPGWAEIHAHVPPIDDLEPMKEVLMLYLANGITTIRGMLGHPKHLELRSKINSGAVLGPHFYATGLPTQALAERWLSALLAEEFTDDPEMKYAKPQDVQNWVKAKNTYMANPNFSKEHAEKLVQIRRKLIYECQKNGVELLLGSDAPQVFNVPGFSIHHEMQYMVDAGLTPYETLRMGTVNVASYLNKPDSGIIKPGNVSDLVLLNGNPLNDISQTRTIEGVMMGTNWLSKAYIQTELKKLEKN